MPRAAICAPARSQFSTPSRQVAESWIARANTGTPTTASSLGEARASSSRASSGSAVACSAGTETFALDRTLRPAACLRRAPPKSGEAAPRSTAQTAMALPSSPIGGAGSTTIAIRRCKDAAMANRATDHGSPVLPVRSSRCAMRGSPSRAAIIGRTLTARPDCALRIRSAEVRGVTACPSERAVTRSRLQCSHPARAPRMSGCTAVSGSASPCLDDRSRRL